MAHHPPRRGHRPRPLPGRAPRPHGLRPVGPHRARRRPDPCRSQAPPRALPARVDPALRSRPPRLPSAHGPTTIPAAPPDGGRRSVLRPRWVRDGPPGGPPERGDASGSGGRRRAVRGWEDRPGAVPRARSDGIDVGAAEAGVVDGPLPAAGRGGHRHGVGRARLVRGGRVPATPSLAAPSRHVAHGERPRAFAEALPWRGVARVVGSPRSGWSGHGRQDRGPGRELPRLSRASPMGGVVRRVRRTPGAQDPARRRAAALRTARDPGGHRPRQSREAAVHLVAMACAGGETAHGDGPPPVADHRGHATLRPALLDERARGRAPPGRSRSGPWRGPPRDVPSACLGIGRCLLAIRVPAAQLSGTERSTESTP